LALDDLQQLPSAPAAAGADLDAEGHECASDEEDDCDMPGMCSDSEDDDDMALEEMPPVHYPSVHSDVPKGSWVHPDVPKLLCISNALE